MALFAGVFVHDPTLHIADCACGFVGEVRITIPSCKLPGMLVIIPRCTVYSAVLPRCNVFSDDLECAEAAGAQTRVGLESRTCTATTFAAGCPVGRGRRFG